MQQNAAPIAAPSMQGRHNYAYDPVQKQGNNYMTHNPAQQQNGYVAMQGMMMGQPDKLPSFGHQQQQGHPDQQPYAGHQQQQYNHQFDDDFY